MGLDERSVQALIHPVAWHEYGHALSLLRSGYDQRARGPKLLTLLPDGLRNAIETDGYRRSEIFDEVVATVFAYMVGRIRDDGYGAPAFLDPDVFAAFQEVIPWPPTQ